jgi:hypothetical protein
MFIIKEIYKERTPEERKKAISNIIIRICKNRLEKKVV